MKKKVISWPVRFVIFCIVLLLAGAIGILWWNDGLSAVDPSDKKQITFTIDKGETVRTIAARLAAERFIRSRTVFFLLVKMKGIDDKLQAGDFQITRSMRTEEVADTLTHGSVDSWVTTLEGWRKEEIATKLTEELKIPEQEFIALGEEGYMFPDTYLLPKNASAAAVVKIFKDNFNKKVTSDMREAASREGLTFQQVITLASLLEREGRTAEDRPVIAGILLNRLEKGMALDVDATLQYAIGYDVNGKTWWKKELTDADKNIQSPYNTYKNPGLPPGPICNPGLISITAALHPQKSDYFYYLHDAKGNIHFGKTLEEHEANIKKYL